MKPLTFIFRFFLSLRYRVILKGTEVLNTSNAKLILPNHQALIDPQILWTYTAKYCITAPVLTESFYNIPVLKQILKRLNTVPVSDLSSGNRDTKVLNTISTQVNKALRNKQNVLLYPSGQLAGQGFEKIFNKQSAWVIVNDIPDDVRIIGVRIHGLWGSMWSRAWIGKSPSFFKTFIKGIFLTLINLLFLTPKRIVTIEYTDITEEAKLAALDGRKAFNNMLEKHYNKHHEEKAKFIKHFFLAPPSKRKLPMKIEGSVVHAGASSINKAKSEIIENVLS